MDLDLPARWCFWIPNSSVIVNDSVCEKWQTMSLPTHVSKWSLTGSWDKSLYVGVKRTSLLCWGISKREQSLGTEQVVGAWAQGTFGQQWVMLMQDLRVPSARDPSVACAQGKEGRPVILGPRRPEAEVTDSHFTKGTHREPGFKQSGGMTWRTGFKTDRWLNGWAAEQDRVNERFVLKSRAWNVYIVSFACELLTVLVLFILRSILFCFPLQMLGWATCWLNILQPPTRAVWIRVCHFEYGTGAGEFRLVSMSFSL